MSDECTKPPAVRRGERPIIVKAILLALQLAVVAARILEGMMTD